MDNGLGRVVAYDSCRYEFQLGKTCIIVSDAMAQLMMEEDSSITLVLDDKRFDCK